MSAGNNNRDTSNRKSLEEGYCLVIAEKPSVAQSIAKVIGATVHRDGYMESPFRLDKSDTPESRGNGTPHYLVSWCVGHLVELALPEWYNEAFAKWRREDLPILPQNTDNGWQYLVSERTKNQFAVLKHLMHRADVASICLATDAGREGELIGRLVYHQCGCTKPMTRLWISSMEEQAIEEGFRNLKPSRAYDSLYQAALCRERADWLVGINGTRFFSCLYGDKLNVGRVMTPTLSMVVHRDMEILSFRPVPFYTVELAFPGFTAENRKMEDRTTAEKLLAVCENAGKAQVKKIQRKEKSEHAPLLYDLTSLQRDANRILGLTAKQTLNYAQSLYEKKLITYPRTDSRYLTDDMRAALPEWVQGIVEKFSVPDFHPEEEGYREVLNSRKVTDHHAIIPTRFFRNADLKDLSSGESAIVKLIASRFLTAVSSPHLYAETVCILSCENAVFTAKGKEDLQEGWKAVEKHFLHDAGEKDRNQAEDADKEKDENQGEREGQNKKTAVFKTLKEGDELVFQKAEIREGCTTPPKRFTEDSLLAAMEAAGTSDLPEQAERRGLGTPATRAGIIEKLVHTGLIRRQGGKKTKYLAATEKGAALISVMPGQIQSPSMTADWEMKLLRIEQNQFSADEFMDEITGFVTDLIRNYKEVEGADKQMKQNKILGICPHCGAKITERQKAWSCVNQMCKFILWKDNSYFNSLGKRMNRSMAEELLQFRKLKLKDCVSKKSGRNFDATVLLDTDDTGRAVFSLESDHKSGGRKRAEGEKAGRQKSKNR